MSCYPFNSIEIEENPCLEFVVDEPLTTAKKHYLYSHGLYKCNVPPVCTARWSYADWLCWIDTNGVWEPPPELSID